MLQADRGAGRGSSALGGQNRRPVAPPPPGALVWRSLRPHWLGSGKLCSSVTSVQCRDQFPTNSSSKCTAVLVRDCGAGPERKWGVLSRASPVYCSQGPPLQGLRRGSHCFVLNKTSPIDCCVGQGLQAKFQGELATTHSINDGQPAAL